MSVSTVDTYTTRPGDVAMKLGFGAVVATVVPPGLLLAPLLSMLAIGFGVAGLSGTGSDTRDRQRAWVGVAVGSALLALSAFLTWFFWPVISDLVHDVRTHR